MAGSEGAAIHPAAAAREGEPIVVKHRISPFGGSDLETLLRASAIDTLVLAGVSTLLTGHLRSASGTGQLRQALVCKVGALPLYLEA